MQRLAAFGFNEMMQLRSKLRALPGTDPQTIEAAAAAAVRLFRDGITDQNGAPICALARIYKTHPYAALDAGLQEFARTVDPSADTIADLRCLVLLATAGDEPEWNSRHTSKQHKAIPLSSESAVAGAPMILQLLVQLGVDVARVVRPGTGLLLDNSERAHNVFYVPRAEGSPSIPAQQQFVAPYGIQSVIGFGGIVSSGDLFAAILFVTVEIQPEVADLFKVIGLNFKLAMLSVMDRPLFSATT